MATQPQYTDRQLEIIKLLDKNKTPKEISKALKITENAVYQQLGRIRKARGETKPKPSRPTKQAAKRASRKRAAAPVAAPAVVTPEVQVPPVQAVRARQREIKAQLTESGQRVEVARKAFEREDEAHAKLVANREEELRQLAVAEAALLGKLPKAIKTRARAATPKDTAPSGNGSQAAQEPAQEPQAATPEPDAAEPQAPVAVPQERPRVPDVQEFAQEDAFPEGEPAA